MNLDQRCQAVELILSDVDGVLTDGRVTYDNLGIESKCFHIRDGMGIRLWHKAGYPFGLLTLRSSHVVRARAAELDIEILRQGVTDKLATLESIR
ncbi:MAG: phenylphosphate carboxylase subunit delta, partial [Pirellulaceae bacterium]|nr:phenylphosphate carboxylase subunit delta [Pirellulaceae bacterium]